MHLRLIFARLVAITCLMAVMTLAPQGVQASIENLQHGLRGDVLASDGGWVVSACDAVDSQCGGAIGDVHGDGHHHHGGDTHAAAVLPTASPVTLALVRLAESSPHVSRQPDDADPGRLGRVPRASIRLS